MYLLGASKVVVADIADPIGFGGVNELAAVPVLYNPVSLGIKSRATLPESSVVVARAFPRRVTWLRAEPTRHRRALADGDCWANNS